MKSKVLKRFNLPSERNIVYRLDAKPYWLLFIISIIGLALCLSSKWRIFGVSLCFASIFFYMLTPSRYLVEFCDEYMIIYHRLNKTECALIYYDEILTYDFVKGRDFDRLEITLSDDRTYSVPIFKKYKINKLLNKYAPDKMKNI